MAGGFRTPLQQLFLLEERARLAGVHLPDESGRDQQLFYGVKCIINGLECVINMRHVVEVIDEKKVTAIPGSAAWIEGVMNYRGTMVPVYKVHAFLKPSAGANNELATADGTILLLKRGRRGGELCAIRINRMLGMQQFQDSDIQTAGQQDSDPDTLEHHASSMVSSEGRNWLLLETPALLDRMSSTNPRKSQ